MPQIPLAEGVSIHCVVDDFLWPWDTTTPVLMMHGFARNALFWNRWVPAVAETHRVYRPDLLGCGLSDQPPPGYRYTPETIAAQIIAVLDRLSLPPVHWVGESSGGIIGLLLAAAHPERIASLVLCNTPTRISDEIRGIYSLDQASTQLQEWCIAEMDQTRPDVAAALHECFEGVNVRPLLAGIQAPVLLLSGDKSRIASEQQKILAET